MYGVLLGEARNLGHGHSGSPGEGAPCPARLPLVAPAALSSTSPPRGHLHPRCTAPFSPPPAHRGLGTRSVWIQTANKEIHIVEATLMRSRGSSFAAAGRAPSLRTGRFVWIHTAKCTVQVPTGLAWRRSHRWPSGHVSRRQPARPWSPEGRKRCRRPGRGAEVRQGRNIMFPATMGRGGERRGRETGGQDRRNYMTGGQDRRNYRSFHPRRGGT